MNKIGANRTVLLVVEQKVPELVRAAQNIQGVQVVGARYLNVYDVLNADCIVFSQSALKATTDWLAAVASPKVSPGKEAK